MEKHIILYGGGNLGKMTAHFLDYLQIPFLYVVDIHAKQIRKDWNNVKVIDPSQVPDMDKKNALLLLCIVTSPIIPIKKKLENEGWKNIMSSYEFLQKFKNKHPLNNGWKIKITEIDKKNINKIQKLFTDKISKLHYKQFVEWRTKNKELNLKKAPINKENRFFIPEVLKTLHNDEIFVDCGSHEGLIIKKFIKLVDNKYKKIYAIEPDKKNLRTLRESITNIPRISVITKAVSNTNYNRKFYEGFGFASRLDKNGNVFVQTDTIDNLNISPTYIKMHLEGEELNALKGAVKTINKYRPKIAVTIYHNSDGLFKTPLFLYKNLKKYKYYFRLHSWAGTGAVLYAIPEERIKTNKRAK